MQHGPETSSQDNQTTQTQGDAALNSAPDAAPNAASNTLEVDSGGGESFFQSLAGGEGTSLAPGMLFLAAILLVLIVIMRSVSKSSARRKQTTRTMGDPEARIAKINHSAQSTMEPARRAMVEAEEITRRLGAVLDNKATKIEILLEEANLKIQQLEEAAKQQADREPTKNRIKSPDKHPMTPETLDQARLDQDRIERGIGANEIHDALKFEDTKTSTKVDANSKPNAESSPEEIITGLAESGLDSVAIAEKLNRPIGEIELILNLWRNSG